MNKFSTHDLTSHQYLLSRNVLGCSRHKGSIIQSTPILRIEIQFDTVSNFLDRSIKPQHLWQNLIIEPSILIISGQWCLFTEVFKYKNKSAQAGPFLSAHLEPLCQQQQSSPTQMFGLYSQVGFFFLLWQMLKWQRISIFKW